MQDEAFQLVEKAVNGDRKALGSLLAGVQDMVYNLSLRMLGSPHDAEDAVQEIMIRIMTKLSTFRRESSFSTWAYRIATNYLINCKKSMFAERPLSWEFYAEDINAGFIPNTEDLMQGVDEGILAEELKQSCTNVMLQCLDPESRCIYILGLMFKADSRVCGEILGMKPEAYRQKLSRIRKRVADFMGEYCGLSKTGKCCCEKRVGYAVQTHRLDPKNLEYSRLKRLKADDTVGFSEAMEEMDRLSDVFAHLPKYRSPLDEKTFLEKLLSSDVMGTIMVGV